MIKFESVKFKNFLVFENGEIPLEKQGVVFIQGINHDENNGSNGAGKSTATSSIIVPLIEDTKTSNEDLVLNKDMEVTTSFKIGQDSYSVTKYQNHTKNKNNIVLLKNGETDPNAPKKIPLLKQYIKNIIGISAADYSHFIHIPQKAFSVLIRGTTTERYKFISDLFELDIYDHVYEKIDERHSLVTSELTGLLSAEGELTQLKEMINQLPSEVELSAELNKKQEYLDASTEEKNEIYSELNRLKADQSIINQIITCKNKYNETSLQAQSITSSLISDYDIKPIHFGDKNSVDLEIMKINKFVSGITDSMQNTDRKIKNKKDYNRISDQLLQYKSDLDKNDVQEQIKEINVIINEENVNKQNLTKLNDLKLKLSKYESVNVIQDEIDTLIIEISENIAIIKNKISVLKGIVSKFESIKDMPICDKCGAPIDKDHAKKEIDSSKLEIDKNNAELIDLNQQLKEMNELKQQVIYKESIKRDISKIPEIVCMTDLEINDILIRKKELEKELEKIVQYNTLSVELNRIPHVTEDIGVLEELLSSNSSKKEKLSNYKNLLNQLEFTFSSLPLNYQKYDTSLNFNEEIEKFEVIYKEITDTYLKVSIELSDIKNKIQNIKNINEKIVKVETKLLKREELLKKDKVYKVLKKAYDKKGLKLEKIKKILTAAQTVLPVYSNLLFKNLSFSVNTESDNVNFKVLKKIGNEIKEYDISKVSGGEECRLIISLVCTFNEINNEKKRSNILILDEVDHYLDNVGAAAFYNEVLPMIREQYESIFIVSQKLEMFSRLYDKRMVVSRKNGISTIEFKSE